MNQKKTIKGFIMVIVGQIFVLLSGIFIGFVIPKALGTMNYGYYKTYTLYLTYFGMLHFGLIEGVYLKYAGKKYEEIDYKSLRMIVRILMIIDVIITVITLASSMIFSGDYRFVVILLALTVFPNHFLGLFRTISQVTMRFKEYSIRNIIQSILQIIVASLVFVLYIKRNEYESANLFIALIVVVQYVLLLWYVITYRKICFGERTKIKDSKAEIKSIFIPGIVLLIANIVSTLIINLDRQFVSVLFDLETYGIYAFAYNIIAIFTTIISAISVVLFPIMKNYDIDKLKKHYSLFSSLILIFVFLCLSGFFPIELIIIKILYEYVDSIIIFRVILPAIAFSCSITVIMHNFFKTLDKNIIYFLISIIILLLSFVANVIAYLLFRTTVSISIASVIMMFLWYLACDLYMSKKCNCKNIRNFIYIVINVTLFYLISGMNLNIYFRFVIYIILYAITAFTCFYSKLRDLKSLFAKQEIEEISRDNDN